MNYIARLENNSDGNVLPAADPRIRLEINPGTVAPEKLTVRVDLPDPQARWLLSGGRYFRGFGYIKPVRVSDVLYEIILPVEQYGPGRYSISLGNSGGNSVYRQKFTFSVQ